MVAFAEEYSLGWVVGSMTYSRAGPRNAGSRTELCQHEYPLRLELFSTEVSFAHLQSATFSYYSLGLELSSTELSLTHLTVSYIQLHSTGLILDFQVMLNGTGS